MELTCEEVVFGGEKRLQDLLCSIDVVLVVDPDGGISSRKLGVKSRKGENSPEDFGERIRMDAPHIR